MGVKIWEMGMFYLVYYLSLSIVYVNANSINREKGTIYIDGKNSIGKIDEDFICATIDWWPPGECDYGICAWGNTSLLNLDLNNQIFFKAIQAFSPLKIRLGGTLQETVIYETKDTKQSCTPFLSSATALFNYTGCLPMKRWDELNAFFNKSGALLVFGLNALYGKTIQSDTSTIGAWDPSNAKSLIQYTLEKGYNILGWELGNELSGNGVGAKISAAQYAADLISLKNLLKEVYKANKSKPSAVGPGGFFDQNWFTEFVNKSGNDLDVLTHHIYNLGPGKDPNIIKHILSPSYLDGEADTFRRIRDIIRSSGTSAVSWVGEAGGAYHSGQNHVTNAFVFSFWYLDQLGMSASYDTKTYCRQSLVGGNYGLLDTTTFVPNPDYYSALLWHRLMGRNVLSTSYSGSKTLRAYAHCSKSSVGITLLLINLAGSTTFHTNVVLKGTLIVRQTHKGWMWTTKWNPKEAAENTRAEYHLTAKDGDLQSETMLLNGKALNVTSSGDIPKLTPIHVKSSDPIVIGPYSIVFVQMPYIFLPACK